ncbi:hypothetical protein M432DRAFT_80224 [Thermoascus aurantiacus ATCC 26904]
MGNESPTPHQLLTEAAIFWSIGVVLYIGRMVSRIIANGSIKRLFLDDYVMTFTFCIYTAMLVLIQISAHYATNLMDPADYDKVLSNPQEVKDRIYGSKIVIGLEQCMLFSTWGIKSCMLIMYYRMTKGLRMNLYVKALAVYVAIGLIVILVTYYAVYCRPFSQYWAMPVKDMQCATYQHYSITQAVFNISSDAAMLAIPIPLLIKAQINLRKKILLMCVMSLGIFVIVAAILNKYFNFASPLTTTYQIWYIREASTAIYVANIMCWWPLLRKIFGFKAFQQSSGCRRYPAYGSRRSSNWHGSTMVSSRRSSRGGPLNCVRGFRDSTHVPSMPRPVKRPDSNGKTLTTTTSEEAINVPSSVREGNHDVEIGLPLEIWHKVEYNVVKSERPAIQKEGESSHSFNTEILGGKYQAEVVCNDTESRGHSSIESERRVESSDSKTLA